MAAVGYNNDTYWNWQTWEKTDPAIRVDQDNPRFLTDTGLRPSYSPVLRRGFIRSAVPEKYTRRRCFFQFNPNLLTRDTANQAGALPWLQDPAQLAIPTGTAAGFGFSFVFNRDMEVSTKSRYTHPRTEEDPTLGIEPVSGLPADPSSGNPNAVAGIGVLADLRVLDEIVGVGFYNSASVDDLRKRFPSPATDNPIGVIPEVPVSGGDFNSGIGALHDDLLRGNTVYMFQQPIRAVFSSLFIVEGYVESMAVTFQKFNFAMVPTICTVNLTIQALYVGVARMKTIVTEYLDNIERYKEPDAVVTVPDTPGPGASPSDPVGDDWKPGQLGIRAPDALPKGVASEAYSYTFLAEGGAAPYRWELRSDVPGMFMDGAIFSGTPAQHGTLPVSILLIDSNGKSVFRTWQWDVS